MRWIALLMLMFATCSGLACDKTIHEARSSRQLVARTFPSVSDVGTPTPESPR